MILLRIQEFIHRFEEGASARIFRLGMLLLAFAALLVYYNLNYFKNFSSPEAMDTAQLARNTADGRGYTTLFLRPLSIHLLDAASPPGEGGAPLREAQPDIDNAPAYPVFLAVMMKVLPFDFKASDTKIKTKSFWNQGREFWWYEPDFLISFINQLLLLVLALGVFQLGRRLFDSSVAWVSAVIVLGSDLLWRFCVAGLSTLFLMLIFTAMLWLLTGLEKGIREQRLTTSRWAAMTVALGVLTALGTLTRYSFGWVMVPLVLFQVFYSGRRAFGSCLLLLITFAIVMAPWMARNYRVSHSFFGAAGYALYETVPPYAGNHLDRSLTPDLNSVQVADIKDKIIGNMRTILREDLPKSLGGLPGAFFLVGLLVAFSNPTLGRLRYFLLMTAAIFALAQAGAQTQTSADNPVVNSENLLVLLLPLVILFGTGLFFTLLERIQGAGFGFRFTASALFCAAASLPMVLTLLGPALNPIAYPPFYPPAIQSTAGWLRENDLMMSDIPWAVAWYGHRRCVWLSLDARDEYRAISDERTVNALYLTPVTLDERLLSQLIRSNEHSWGDFVKNVLLYGEVPKGFPLTKAPDGFLPEQFFLADSAYWRESSGTNAAPH